MKPDEVLKEIKKIEGDLNTHPHRNDDGGYADREIDIDIMAADELVIETPELTLPHPRLTERRFFLEPFAELAPRWRHPRLGLTLPELINKTTP